MSDLIKNKLDRLIKHLSQGGSEDDAVRVLKVRDEETVQQYLTAAKEALGEEEEEAPAPVAKPKKSAKKKATPPPVEEEVEDDDDDLGDEDLEEVEEEVVEDEDDDDDEEEVVEDEDDDDDEEFDDDDEYPEEVVEEVVEKAKSPDKPSEKKALTKEGLFEKKSFFLLDSGNRKVPLQIVADKPDQTILKVYEDTPVKIKVGKETVTVLKDATMNHEGPVIQLPNGGSYPTEFVKAAIQLAEL